MHTHGVSRFQASARLRRRRLPKILQLHHYHHKTPRQSPGAQYATKLLLNYPHQIKTKTTIWT